jgi:hypothetical protein
MTSGVFKTKFVKLNGPTAVVAVTLIFPEKFKVTELVLKKSVKNSENMAPLEVKFK